MSPRSGVRGARGSNQYRTEPGMATVPGRLGLLQVHRAADLDDDVEEVGWAFNPDRDRWDRIGVDYQTWRSWTAAGGTYEEAKDWFLNVWGGANPLQRWDDPDPAAVLWWVFDDETQSPQIRTGRDRDRVEHSLRDHVTNRWDADHGEQPADLNLAMYRLLHADDSLDVNIGTGEIAGDTGWVAVISGEGTLDVAVTDNETVGWQTLVHHVNINTFSWNKYGPTVEDEHGGDIQEAVEDYRKNTGEGLWCVPFTVGEPLQLRWDPDGPAHTRTPRPGPWS